MHLKEKGTPPGSAPALGLPTMVSLMVISDTLPGTVPGQQLDDSGEALHPVPGESLQYGLDLTHFRAIIDNTRTDDVPYWTQGMYGHTSTGGGSQDSN